MIRSLLISLLFLVASPTEAQVLTLEGNYKGTDLYVRNPFSEGTRDTYCVDSVKINGQPAIAKIQASAFAIYLDSAGFKLGDHLVIKIFHKPGCGAKVLNPSQRTYFGSIEITGITKNGTLSWKAEYSENATPGPYIVEQYKWHKWVEMEQVEPLSAKPTTYTATVPMHSGENTFRIHQNFLGVPRHSNEVKIDSDLALLKHDYDKVKKVIDFSAFTQYELYTKKGILVKVDSGTTLDLSGMTKGVYYLNFDNETQSIKVRP